MADNSEEHVTERVKAVVMEVLKVDASKVSSNSDLRADLGADSIDLMTLIVSLEEEFDGKISDDEVLSIVTIEDTVQLIQDKILNAE